MTPDEPLPPTHEVLERAAELISGGHFGKGALVQILSDGKVGYCVRGALGAVALDLAANQHDAFEAANTALLNYLDLEVPAPEVVPAVTNWNDAPERTEAEVVAALRGAAALLERTTS